MQSLTLWLLLSFLIAAVIYFSKFVKKKRLVLNRANAWPEVLDLIISALQSGASITESLANLAKVGPLSIRADFAEFAKNVSTGMRFELALSKLKNKFSDPIADQLCESLFFASKFGSRNTVRILRELSEYVSSDLAVRAEINTRFGWIRNSANLAALAPWLLLLILRTQENARIAYQQNIGQFLMLVGVIATALAYIWMNKIAELPKSKRLFTLALDEK
jgi:tight adherence protein B